MLTRGRAGTDPAMLSSVVAHKRGGRKKPKTTTVSHNSLIQHDIKPNASPKFVVMENGIVRTRRTRKGVQDVSNNQNDTENHRITEYFPVRRSGRKTAKQIEAEEMFVLQQAILRGTNEKFLEIYNDPMKGRGIRAMKKFRKHEFVIEYKGELVEQSIAKHREAEYSEDNSIGSYMYFFKAANRSWCIDATKETEFKGRLINHSTLRPNLRTKAIEFDGYIYLVLMANRDIDVGEELLYDYGDRTADVIAKNPWLINS